jgi:hypothetical protein
MAHQFLIKKPYLSILKHHPPKNVLRLYLYIEHQKFNYRVVVVQAVLFCLPLFVIIVVHSRLTIAGEAG